MNERIGNILRMYGPFGFRSHGYPNPVGMVPCEMRNLVWCALNSDPKANWMEIGAFYGGSAVLLCLARREMEAGPSVVSVDNWSTGNKAKFEENIAKGSFQEISKAINIDSGELPKHYDGAPLSLAFIDAWHSFKGAYTDFCNVHPWVVPGGYVLFHDVHKQADLFQPGGLDRSYELAKAGFEKEMTDPSIPPERNHDIVNQRTLEQVVALIVKEYPYELVKPPYDGPDNTMSIIRRMA